MSAMPSASPVWPAAFADLVAEAHGRHPIELLGDLQADPSPDARRLAAEARAIPDYSPVFPQGNGLALPHPLDAEWRFSEDTARALLERAVAATQRGDAILLLGVPTLVLAAAESKADRRFCAACEENIIGAGLAALTASDSRFEPRNLTTVYAAAIVDPPWYPTIFASLLGQAAGACRQGGLIFASAPPMGVRPTSAAERVELQAHAANLGLVLIETEPEALTYRTPAFEAAAMQAAGLSLALPLWRGGDLLVFRREQLRGIPGLPAAPAAFELTLEGVRLRLLASGGNDVDRVEPLVDGEVLPSVSTRTPWRARANLWTSGNRAFVCPPAATLAAMQALAVERDLWPKGLDPKGTEDVDSTSIDAIQLVSELAGIVARDLAHMAALVGVSSWDRAANDARFLNGSATTFQQALRGGGG